MNGIRTLCKDNDPVTILPLEEALAQFLNFLKASTTEASKRTTKKVCIVLAGHNAATFDVPILLRNGGHSFVTELTSVNIRCADTLLLFKSRMRDKHSSLQNEQGQFPKPNQSSLYEHLFKETFEAHDALEDVSALRRILFSSRVALSNEIIVNRSSLISVKDAAQDMKYLDDRHNRLLSFRGKLYHPGHQDSPVKQNIAEKMAGSGLQYSDLKNLFQRFGRKGLVCILSKPPLSARNKNSTCNSETFRGNFKQFYFTVGTQPILKSKICPFSRRARGYVHILRSKFIRFLLSRSCIHYPKQRYARVRVVGNFTHAQIVILANSYSVTYRVVRAKKCKTFT